MRQLKKHCSGCDQTKPIEEFSFLTASPDGHLGHCRQCINEYYLKHKEQILKRTRQWDQNLRTEVLTHYGNGRLACVICRFDDIRALCIDHIEGGGREHRRQLSKKYLTFYYWLKQQGFPEGYQTLCLNCNTIKKIEMGEQRGGRPWKPSVDTL